MKKVGIITLHIGDNYGALLQCYALRTAVKQLTPYTVSIINFDPGREFPHYTDEEVQENYSKKLEKFRAFNREENGVSEPVLYDLEKETPDYDYYITGSDQVWNTSFVFAKEAFFLNFVPDHARRIAYAASIGIPVDSPKLKTEWFARNIPKFDWLSLREMSYQPFLQPFTDKRIYSVVDPTLLLTPEEYDRLCENVDPPKGDYILLYFLKHDQSAPLLISLANRISRKWNLKVVYSFAKVPDRVFKNPSETFYYSGPKEFVAAVKHAKVVITNSFHGTIFSLLYHRPFFTYLVGSMASRVTDLLKDVGLEDRIVYGCQGLTDDMLEVDFTRSDTVIQEKRRESKEYLRNALDVTDLELSTGNGGTKHERS